MQVDSNAWGALIRRFAGLVGSLVRLRGLVGMVRHPSKGNDYPTNYSTVVLKSKLKCWAFGLKNLKDLT